MEMKYLYLEVTRRCNQRCVQCFNNSRDALFGELGTEAIRRILDKFREQGGERLQITGGEALLRPDIGEILEHAKSLQFSHIVLSTNGMLFKESIADKAAAIVNEVDFSLDGFGRTHDTMRGVRCFDITIDAIRRATARQITTYVCCCLTPDTYSRLEEFLDLLVSLNVRYVKLAQIGHVGRRGTPEQVFRSLPTVRQQFERISELSMRYAGKITIQQSHTTTVQRVDVDRDGLVCDPCGRLYPMIGYLPEYWQIGSAYPHWKIEHRKLHQYEKAFEQALGTGIQKIVADGAVNWWLVLHEALEVYAPQSGARA